VSEHPNPAEPDGIDALLRDTMAASPPPALPSTFTERVTARLRPRRLRPGARRVLRLYTLAAAALSVSVMASLGGPWILIASALAVPAAIGLLLLWRSRRESLAGSRRLAG
jgi:hypothetical protein